MKRKLLHKYFRAESSPDENREIVDWVEKSDENRHLFLSERRLWNTSVLLDDKAQEEIPKKKFFISRRIIWQVASTAAILIFALGIWNYTGERNVGEQTVIVPVGQRVNLILSDGTSVWLNSNTTFNYPARFNRRKREVKVNGEAYFEVSHNEKSPFIVNTEKYDIEVLGTTFNVYAYSDYIFEAALLEGSVRIRDNANKTDITMSPNEKVFERDNKLYKVKDLNQSAYRWKNGILSFDDTPINEVVNMLGAYYDKKIIMEYPEQANYRCTSKFLYNDGLDYILKVLQKDLHYKIEKDTINDIIILK